MKYIMRIIKLQYITHMINKGLILKYNMIMDLERIKKEFGLRVKAYRKQNNQTQEDFSELIELEQPSLSNLENGKVYPTFTTICNLITKAGIEPNSLFDFLLENSGNKHKRIDNNIINTLKHIDDEIVDLLKHVPTKTKEHIKEIIKTLAE